jgi:uncharacterized protein YlaI
MTKQAKAEQQPSARLLCATCEHRHIRPPGQRVTGGPFLLIERRRKARERIKLVSRESLK